MLDNETKRRIDTARDILVGKVPDPKSQVEQITIALIYKFMDDMDLEAEELGGHPNFFTGEYEKYGWRKIFDPALGGHEMLGLYGDAITRMALNPNLPQLFRDIFKNAYLPYRDPETLKSFLKIIDDFTYDQSEKLGDAFEYLLSVLGSQGDAGQFRTPRHIIDFMTAILNPRKTDTILDPACGTAGFLISAWKHILRNNSSGVVGMLHATSLPSLSDEKYQGDQLTPDDRTRITGNIRGYDISPDMVRLSLVNLYLHGFPEPHIYEYDSLTSEDRWNEFYDVILANPPFMSPKGGIRPHKRFSVQSNRSEVLFVDLMAEHLTPGGRAAIVVPEGIIFQSGTAYKSLRKMLVDDYLVGVISLPAGVFNPYSGVKTSILWLDKSLARKTNQILFAKITADGFDLGAQRRPVKQNDLPGAFRAIQQYIDLVGTRHGVSLQGLAQQDSNDDGDDDAIVRPPHGVAQQSPESTLQSIYPHITLVAKSAIAENGDYNLSGERYKINALISSQYEFVKLGEVCEINPKKSELKAISPDLEVSFVPMQDVSENSIKLTPKDSRKLSDVMSGAYTYFTEGDVLLAKVTPCFENGKAGIAKNLLNNVGFGSSELFVIRPSDLFKPEFIYYMVSSSLFKDYAIPKMTGTGGLQRVPKSSLEEFQIPLPPLSVQQEIVTEIEAYQKVIDGARQVVENYKPRITIDPDWKMVELGTIYRNLDGKRRPITSSDRKEGIMPYYGASGIVDFVEGFLFDEELLLVSEDGANLLARSTPIAFSVSGKIWVNNHAHVLKFENRSTQIYIEIYLNSIPLNNYITGAAQPKLNQKALNSILIPLPPLEIQQQIVAQIEREQELVNASKELIALFEQKTKDRIARVWGE